jgi:hypothetical protein
VLDDVPGRRLLVQPAREDPAELAVRAAHIQLDESAGQLLDLPGLGRLTGPQPDDRVADPDRLARPQREVSFLPVALVEEAKHGDTLRHRRGARSELVHRLGNIARLVLELGLLLPVGVLGAARRAAGEREQHRQASADHRSEHLVQSGVHA